MKKVSFMSDLLETLRQEGVDPALLAAVEEYRAAHPLAEALRTARIFGQALAVFLRGQIQAKAS